MKIIRSTLIAFLVALLSSSMALGSATVEQHTKVHFGGFLGGVINLFGGRATREGVDSTSVVNKDRRAEITGDRGEIVDLNEEKLYRIDYGRKTYSVMTFDELRKQFEDAQKRAREQQPAKKEGTSEEKAPELEFDVDIKETGAKEKINGYDTHQVIVTVTARQKGKTLDEAGGAVLTGDLWIGPRVAALDELAAFDVRYYKKLYGSMIAGVDPQQMAAVLAAAPSFAEAMKKFEAKKAALEGTPIRTITTFELVAAPGSSTEDESAHDSTPTSASGMAAKALGGFLSKRKKKNENEAGPNRSTLFSSTNEITNASLTADQSKLTVPPGFRQK